MALEIPEMASDAQQMHKELLLRVSSLDDCHFLTLRELHVYTFFYFPTSLQGF
jgi:hypothetical protein